MEKVSSPELLQEIFSHLTVSDLKTVRLVCKDWRAVTFLPRLNEKVRVSIPCSDTSEISRSGGSGTWCFEILNLNLRAGIRPFCLSFWLYHGASLKRLNFDSVFFHEDVHLPGLLQLCPNLDAVHLENCKGLKFGLELDLTGSKLKELQIKSCNDANSSVSTLVSILSSCLTKFVYGPYASQNLTSQQLREIFEHTCQTLTEVDVTWEKPQDDTNSLEVDFETIFSVPSLKLKNVSLACYGHFEDMIGALLSHQKESLEELSLIDGNFPFDDQLKLYLSSDLPNLKKFTCSGPGDYDNTRKINELSVLRSAMTESHSSLREIKVEGLTHLTRKKDSDWFAVHEFFMEFRRNNLFVDAQDEVVGSFLQELRYHHLTKLKLMHVDLSQHGLADVIFVQCVNLVELSLKRCNLSDSLLLNDMDRSREASGYQGDILFPVINFPRLESLVLSDNPSLTWCAVTRRIGFPRLKRLDMGRCAAFCENHCPFALNNAYLEIVAFPGIRLTDRVIVAFARNSPRLESLDISGNRELTNFGICELRKFKQLKNLKLR